MDKKKYSQTEFNIQSNRLKMFRKALEEGRLILSPNQQERMYEVLAMDKHPDIISFPEPEKRSYEL